MSNKPLEKVENERDLIAASEWKASKYSAGFVMVFGGTELDLENGKSGTSAVQVWKSAMSNAGNQWSARYVKEAWQDWGNWRVDAKYASKEEAMKAACEHAIERCLASRILPTLPE